MNPKAYGLSPLICLLQSPSKLKPILGVEVKHFLALINSSYLPAIFEYEYSLLVFFFFNRLIGEQQRGKADEDSSGKTTQT